MASIIKIKRSGLTAEPTTLETGELAYSYEESTGGKLYIGIGDEVSNTAPSISTIGGKFFTDKLDHTPGITIANSAIITDDNNRIDEINISYVTIADNVISTVFFEANTVSANSSANSANTDTTPEGASANAVPLVIQTLGGAEIDVSGSIITNLGEPAANSDAVTKLYVDTEIDALKDFVNLDIEGDTGSESIVLESEILRFTGDTGITTVVANNEVRFDLDDTAVTPGTYGSNNAVSVFTVDQQGRITTAADVSIQITKDQITSFTEEVEDVVGALVQGDANSGITVTYDDPSGVLTVSAEDATTFSKGVAQFSSDDFEVTSGNVELEDNVVKTVITDSGTLTPNNHTFSVLGVAGVNVTHSGTTISVSSDPITIGNTAINLGETETAIAGLTSIQVGDFTVSSDTITTTNSLVISANGVVDVSNSRITSVSSPTANTDAATKGYVDSEIESLDAAINFNYTGDSGSDSLFLATETLDFVGGTGLTSTVANNSVTFDLDNTTVTPGSYGSSTEIPVLTIDAQGRVTLANTASISTNLSIAGDSGTDDISLLDDTLTFTGGTGITTAVSNNVVTISGDDATTSTKGIASFADANFTVSGGAVTAKSITLGSSTLTLGSTTTAVAGITQLDVDNIRIDGNTISSTNENGNIVLSPDGTGVIDASTSRIINVVNPTGAQDVATKQYVDTIASASLHYHNPVRVESPINLNATYDNGTAGVGATLTNAGTQAALVIDGVTLDLDDRVLVYEQANTAHNGVYTVTDTGSVSTNWELTRAVDADSYAPSDPTALGTGDAFFVSEGSTGAGELYVMTTEGAITFGTTAILFSQIAAAQIYSAGDGLSLTGTVFSVNVDDSSIEISADALRVKAAGITNDMLAGSISNEKLVNSSITFAAETGTSDPVSLGETITFAAGEGINTTVSNNQITIAGEDASDTNKGIASFSLTDFVVTSGNVELEDEAIQDIVAGFVVGGTATTITYDEYAYELTFDSDLATTSTVGVASFSSTDFVVTSGNVELEDEAIQDIVAAFVIGGTATTITYDEYAYELTFDSDLATTSTVGVASFSSTNFAVANGDVTITAIDGGTY